MSDANVAPFRYAVSQGGERNTIVATADYYEEPAQFLVARRTPLLGVTSCEGRRSGQSIRGNTAAGQDILLASVPETFYQLCEYSRRA